MTWLHACYGIGTMLGPLLITGTIASGRSWRVGYVVLAVALGAMAVAFAATAVWLSLALFFLYTGLEVTAAQWMYSVFTKGRGFDMHMAGFAVSAYWASLSLGRIVFGALAARHDPERLLRVSLALAPGAALMTWWAPRADLGLLGLAALGFAFAPIYPLLVAITPERLGRRHLTQAVGLQVAVAYLGTAALPGAGGALAASAGLEVIPAFVIPAPWPLRCCTRSPPARLGGRQITPAGPRFTA